MRTLNTLFALLVLVAALAAQPPIAVLDFDGEGLSESERRALTNKLRSALFQTGSYTILERSRMEEILREMGFQRTGCTDMSCAVEMGQLLNVRFIVMGSVDKVASTYAVNARMVEVATGTIRADVVEDCKRCSLDDVMADIMEGVAGRLVGGKASSTATGKSKRRIGLVLEPAYGFFVMGGDEQNVNVSIDGFDWPELMEIPTRNGFGVGLGLKVGRSEFGGVFHTFPFGYSQQPGDSIHWVGGGDTIAGSVGSVTRYIGAGLYYHFELLRMGRLVSILPGIALGYWGDYIHADASLYQSGTWHASAGTELRSDHGMKLYLRTELALGKVALFNDQVLTVGQDGSGWHMHFGASLDLTGLVKGPPSGS